MSPEQLPEAVLKVKRYLEERPEEPAAEVADRLIHPSPELISMWRSLEESKAGEDDLWVWAFLEVATRAYQLPRFHHYSAKQRQDLARKINKLTSTLASEIEQNGLDFHLIYSGGKLFPGFYVYEDYGESNQARIEATGLSKLQATDFIRQLSARCEERLLVEPVSGKAGVNAQAIRFLRMIAKRNEMMYGSPLHRVTATATNAVYGTSYEESDIAHLLNR